MINSVSGINFRGDAPVNAADLINSPGKFTTAPAVSDVQPDTFEKAGEEKKGHKGGAIGTVLGLLALAYIALGVAAHKGTLSKIENPEGFMQKTKNFFHKIGESADNLWGKIRGKKAEAQSKTPNTEAPAAKVEEK